MGNNPQANEYFTPEAASVIFHLAKVAVARLGLNHGLAKKFDVVKRFNKSVLSIT